MTPASETVKSVLPTTSERRIAAPGAPPSTCCGCATPADLRDAAPPRAQAHRADERRVAVRLERDDGELAPRPPEERVVVALRLRPALPEDDAREPFRLAEVGDVEERRLRADHPAFVGRVLPDPEQEVAAERVQVGRVAADLQLAADDGPRGGREIECVERIDLPEGDDVPDVADEANGVDALALAEPADLPERDERIAALAERRDGRLALGRLVAPPHGELGAGDPQDPVLLGDRPLPEEGPRDDAARPVVRLRRARDVEAVDRRRRRCGNGASGLEPLVPALGRDVEARRRGVDDPPVRHHGVRVERVEAAVDVDRQHRDQPEPGEARSAAGCSGIGRGCRARRPCPSRRGA